MSHLVTDRVAFGQRRPRFKALEVVTLQDRTKVFRVWTSANEDFTYGTYLRLDPDGSVTEVNIDEFGHENERKIR